MEMVWKSHTKVSVGYVEKADDKTSWVVYWFCPKRDPKDFKKHRKQGATATTWLPD
jgi:hypothetical protein